jgi:hypothetical protein
MNLKCPTGALIGQQESLIGQQASLIGQQATLKEQQARLNEQKKFAGLKIKLYLCSSKRECIIK